MIDLTDGQAVDELGRKLFLEHRGTDLTFEGMAQMLCQELFNTFRQADGTPIFALLRIFRFGVYDDLNDILKPKANQTDASYWLTLMGTMGIQEAWCSRQQSEGHQVIPADSPVTPMLKAAFSEIGLQFGNVIKGEETLVMEANRNDTALRHFFIPTALGNQNIPAQEEFVIPHKIQSVVGIGSPFIDDSAYMCLGFAQAELTRTQATNFSRLNSFVGTLLAQKTAIAVWG